MFRKPFPSVFLRRIGCGTGAALLLALPLAALPAAAQESVRTVGPELREKRESLPSLHQVFEMSETIQSAGGTESFTSEITLDIAQHNWREQRKDDAGESIRIFDGKDLLMVDVDGKEYSQKTVGSKDKSLEPHPYGAFPLDWTKAKLVDRIPCGFPQDDHLCLRLDVPLTGSTHLLETLLDQEDLSGDSQLTIDFETGALVRSRTTETVNPGWGRYVVSAEYSLKNMTYGYPADPALFRPPDGARKVKKLSPWAAPRIKTELAGQPAPGLHVTDITGKPVSLADLKGKTVLLDFWTTWCPPCRADAPFLDKLFTKYGGKNLMIIGISVDERRAAVEKFLKDHPHDFPVVLSSENQMPRPYQIGIFPTYIVISPDGTVSTAVEGSQGFGDLRKVLKKAGMDTD